MSTENLLDPNLTYRGPKFDVPKFDVPNLDVLLRLKEGGDGGTSVVLVGKEKEKEESDESYFCYSSTR